MFTELHKMAKAAMLLITATAEGDQLRISISPTYADGKIPAGGAALRPLTLVGTPDELNADFAAALAVWQTPPKRSIIAQAKAAAQDGADDAAPANTAPQPAPKVVDSKEKQKGGRKAKPVAEPQADASAQPGSEDAGQDAATAVGEPSGETAVPAVNDAAPASPAPETSVPADVYTIDLF